MATQSNRLDKASAPQVGRRFGSGLRNSDFGPNAPLPTSQRNAASGALDTPVETNSSESRIALHAENAHCSDAHASSRGFREDYGCSNTGAADNLWVEALRGERLDARRGARR